jgi:hypothetical protein
MAVPENTLQLAEDILHSEANIETVGESRLDFTRLLDMLYHNLTYQVEIADNKASLILAANAILLAGVTIERGILRMALFEGNVAGMERLSTLMLVLTMTSLAVSVVFALLASRPTLVRPGMSERHNLFYFMHMREMDANTFSQRFLEMSMMDVKVTILHQLHAMAAVVKRKYAGVRVSLWFLVFALLGWGAARLMLALA